MKSIIKLIIPKVIREKLKEKRREKKLQDIKSTIHITKDDLIKSLHDLGIVEGDSLFVHSSLSGLGYIDGGAMTVIEALMASVGPSGNLIFPTFSMNPTMLATLEDQSFVFDPESTESTVGSITNKFMKIDGVHRSIHPTHSVAAWGKDAAALVKDHFLQETNFGSKTPFGSFLDLNGKIVGIGISFGPVTFYHVFEDMNLNLFPSVYLPEKFNSKVKVNDKVIVTSIGCHNPDFHKNRIDKTEEIEAYLSDYFRTEGVAQVVKLGKSKIWSMNSRNLMFHLKKMYDKGITIYHTPNLSSN